MPDGCSNHSKHFIAKFMKVFSWYFLATFSRRIGEGMLYFSLALLLLPAVLYLLFLHGSPAFARVPCALLCLGF